MTETQSAAVMLHADQDAAPVFFSLEPAPSHADSIQSGDENHCCRCTHLEKKSLESIPRFQRRKYIDFEELPEKALLAGPLAVLCAGFFAIDRRPPGMNRCVLRSSSKDRRDRAPQGTRSANEGVVASDQE